MLNDKLYQLDFFQLGIQLLPTQWRTPIHIFFVKVLAVPFVFLLGKLTENRKNWIKKLTHSASLGHLQKLANDEFDSINRRIEVIVNKEIKTGLYTHFPRENRQIRYTFFPSENKPKRFTFFPKERAEFEADFFVLVPKNLLSQKEINRLDNMVRDFAKKDKHFTIKEI